jgi:basic amino acid/polyamine antiporter, APA family
MAVEDFPRSRAAASSSSAVAPAVAHEGLFVRQSSGLVREIGARDAFNFSINFASLPGNIALGMLVVLALFPGSDPALTGIVVGIQCVFVALTYSYLVGAMPRSGGDYVYLGRAVSPVLGTAMGVALLLVTGLTVCQIAYTISQVYLPPAITIFGGAVGLDLNGFATDVGSTHLGQLLSAGLLIALAALIAFAGNKAARRTLAWGFLLGLLGTLIIIFEALTHSTGHFVSAFNHAVGNPHAYDQVIAAARRQHAQFGITLSGVLNAAPLLALFFAGFAYASFAAGELKRPSRTYKVSTIGAALFFTVVFAVSWWSLKAMAGSQFLHAAAFLTGNDPDTYAKITHDASASAPYLSSVVSGNAFLDVVPPVTYVIGYATLIVAELFVFSRLAFAMAFDRVLPTRLADVSARRHAPLKALLLGTAVSLIFLAFAVFTTTFLSLLRVLAIVYLVQVTVASVVATLLPWLRRELYEASPKLFSGTWLGIPSITVIGGIAAVTNGLFLYFAVTKTQISGGWDANSIVTLAVIGLSGVVVYFLAKALMARRGVDLAMAMHELPPE